MNSRPHALPHARPLAGTLALPFALAAALLLAACSTAPVGPLPPPLPAALAWPAGASESVFLGIDGEENSGDSLDALTFDPGVRVRAVVANSPAAQAGLTVGDVVLEVDGHEVDDPGALETLVQQHPAGHQLRLLVRRGDTAFDVQVSLAGAGGPRAAPEPRFLIDPARSRAGWATLPVGVRLVTSAPEGPFPEAGLPVGSVVLVLDDEPVLSARDLIRKLAVHEPGDDVRVTALLPDGQEVQRTVELFEMPTRITEFGLAGGLFALLHWQAPPDGRSADFSLIDLWFIELFQYHRDLNERRWVVLELFGWEILPIATGEGELSE